MIIDTSALVAILRDEPEAAISQTGQRECPRQSLTFPLVPLS
jgi:uncharacterized protein with PIN domain